MAAGAPSCNRELGADDGFDAGREGGLVESGRAVDTIAIEQRQGRIPEIRRSIDERFGQRSALKKTESRSRVEFDVRRRHGSPQGETERSDDAIAELQDCRIAGSEGRKGFRGASGSQPSQRRPR